MFYLLDQPTEEEFQSLARRYKDMEPSSVKAAVTLLKTGSDLLTGFEKMLQRYGLSQGRFLILVVMNRQPGQAMSPSVLAQKIGVTRATMTGLIDGLVRDGYIARDRHPSDRRKQDLLLTQTGKTLLESLLPDYWSRLFELMSGLTSEEEEKLVLLLNKVARGIPALT
ncbi:MAG: MarR family transcriptional regulator, partial [Desulfovibrio sp.]